MSLLCSLFSHCFMVQITIYPNIWIKIIQIFCDPVRGFQGIEFLDLDRNPDTFALSKWGTCQTRFPLYTQDSHSTLRIPYSNTYTVFDLITAPALITPPPRLWLFTIFSLIIAHLMIFFLTFYFIFTYYHPLDDLLALVVKNKLT